MLVRLACTLIAGAIIGYNRGEHGKAAAGAFVLWVVKRVELMMVREFRARLTVTLDASTGEDLREQLRANGLTIVATTVQITPDHRVYVYDVLQSRAQLDGVVPAFIDTLAREPGVRTLRWRPAS